MPRRRRNKRGWPDPFVGPVVSVPPSKPPLDQEEVVRLATVEGLSAAEIARRLGYSPVHVRRVLSEQGVRLRPERRREDEPHGERLYSTWLRVRHRCENPKSALYPRYGARGFTVCPEWATFWPFYDWAIASGYEPQLILDVQGDSQCFSPASCRWITARERRQRDGPSGRAPRLFEAFGERKSVPEWARDPRCQVGEMGLWRRLHGGVPVEEAITLPPRSPLPEKEGKRAQPASSPTTYDWPEVERLHLAEGLSAREIAERVGGKWQSIRTRLVARGTWRPHKKPLHERRLRRVWESMRLRCEDPTHHGYRWYGARGARVCAEWRDFRAFHAWAIHAGYRPGLYLTRRTGTLEYSARSCTWSESAEAFVKPVPHAKPPPHWTFEAFGERKGPTDWSRDPRCKVSLYGLIYRLRKGWNPEAAIATPSNRRGPPRPTGREHLITAFGVTKSLSDWERDRRCAVSITTLNRRLARGVPPEEAIRTPPFRGRPPAPKATPEGGSPNAGQTRGNMESSWYGFGGLVPPGEEG